MEMTKIDLKQLRKEIRELNRTKVLYRLLRDELSAIGHWKQRPRGDPVKGYRARGKKNGISNR